MTDRPSRIQSRPGLDGPGLVYVLIFLTSAIELGLSAADLGWIGSPYWRGAVFGQGAFYRQILTDWQGNFALQPLTMFVSYAFLHANWLHLLINMIALASFGTVIAAQVGAWRFLSAYLLCAIGGGAAHALLSSSAAPVVGASGALFGLLGIWICWGYLDRRRYGEGQVEILRAIGILVLYNLAFWYLLAGRLAWEAHLGGFVTGWVIALFWGRPVYRRRRRGRRRVREKSGLVDQ